eukprot:CAMPEP_0170450718 /NCGR_PEP_ID=MMETSP0123-20130129/165_1 /TAXON_ID=182087 /ORGANISM="Favella ehrenbergii, Strain Fehren 1" /LENGTH=92 /DNA_ID=CAMNT_0010712101 /DNA_START=407 /DNA_END=685 /DNA_ORIENTATION=-
MGNLQPVENGEETIEKIWEASHAPLSSSYQSKSENEGFMDSFEIELPFDVSLRTPFHIAGVIERQNKIMTLIVASLACLCVGLLVAKYSQMQ